MNSTLCYIVDVNPYIIITNTISMVANTILIVTFGTVFMKTCIEKSRYFNRNGI
jgi:hypothetical protein